MCVTGGVLALAIAAKTSAAFSATTDPSFSSILCQEAGNHLLCKSDGCKLPQISPVETSTD